MIRFRVLPSPAKRARKPNFTPAECAVIFEKAEENLKVIKSKFSSTLTNKNKSRVWKEITNKVNALGVCKRDVQYGREGEVEKHGEFGQKKSTTSVPFPAKRPAGENNRTHPRTPQKKLFNCLKRTRHLAAFPVVLIPVSKCNVYKLLL